MSDFSFSDLVSILQRVEETKTVSLPQFTRPASLQSPMFIQNSLLEEPIIPDTIKNLYNLYTGYILTALNMTRVVGDRTIRDIIQTVSTETSIIPATESFLGTDDITAGFESALEASSEKGNKDSIIDKSSRLPIASGRILEVEFDVGEGRIVKAPIQINFNPRTVPSQVVEYMIATEFKQSIQQRWLQMQAGELRFFKDFIMQLDTLEKREKALKHDKDNALGDLFRYQNKAGLRQILKFAMAQNRTFNLANSVLILDEQSVKKYAKKQGVRFSSVKDRRRFFAKTYSLFIVLIDANYSQVTIMTNGIDDIAQYTFNEIKTNADRDAFDLKEIIEVLSSNKMPNY